MTIRRKATLSPEVARALAASGVDVEDGADGNEQLQATPAAPSPAAPASTPAAPAAPTPAAPAPTPAAPAPAPSTPAPAGTPDAPGAEPGGPIPASPAADPTPAGQPGSEPAPASTPSNAPAPSAQVADLQTQLAVANARVSDLRGERDSAMTELATLRATTQANTTSLANQASLITALEGSLRVACQRLCVGLNANASDLPSLNGAALVARFETLSADLTKKYPNSGKPVSSVTALPVKNTQSAVAPAVAAAIAATQYK